MFALIVFNTLLATLNHFNHTGATTPSAVIGTSTNRLPVSDLGYTESGGLLLLCLVNIHVEEKNASHQNADVLKMWSRGG
jgi:hypothetical protein